MGLSVSNSARNKEMKIPISWHCVYERILLRFGAPRRLGMSLRTQWRERTQLMIFKSFHGVVMQGIGVGMHWIPFLQLLSMIHQYFFQPELRHWGFLAGRSSLPSDLSWGQISRETCTTTCCVQCPSFLLNPLVCIFTPSFPFSRTNTHKTSPQWGEIT